jgi:predicted amidohydrolase YtcJ
VKVFILFFCKKLSGMKYLNFLIIFLLYGCSMKQSADIILINGKVCTVNERDAIAQAIAISGKKIIAVGSNSDVLKFKSPDTKIVDLAGQSVVPGLIEGHGHFMSMGFNKMELDLSYVKSFEELAEKVKTAAGNAEPGSWIIGRGWHQSKWSKIPGKVIDGYPSHELLSIVSPDNPVFLEHASGHAALVNGSALKISGINRDTKFTGEGEILRDEKGEPTGILLESAAGLVETHIPEHTRADDIKAFRLANEECLKNGITSFHDAGVDFRTLDFYKEMLDSGELKVRLYVMISGSDDSILNYYLKRGPEVGLGDDFLNIRAIKLFADGALGSRGAWLLAPYSDLPGHTGAPAVDSINIYNTTLRGLKAGFQVCTHAIGDRANREVLNIYEKAFQEVPGATDPRFRIEHAQHLSEKDIPRFKSLGVIPSMQAIHLSSDRPWAIDRLGEVRIKEGAYAWQKLIQTGVKIINGTDVPVEPINPIACFYASVTRKTLQGNPPEGYEPDQKMTREQALQSYTINSAYGEFSENKKGTIEVGKLADLTVLSKDIMTVPEDEILSTAVSVTIINGKIVYERK